MSFLFEYPPVFSTFSSLAAEMNNTVSSLFLPQYIVMSTILALLEYQMLTVSSFINTCL